VLGRCGGSSVRRPPAARWARRWRAIPAATVIYDWGGGLIWAALPPNADAQAALVRPRVDAVGGHAMLLRASDQVRPQRRCVSRAKERRRRLERTRPPRFRSESILNRGRMIRGSAT